MIVHGLHHGEMSNRLPDNPPLSLFAVSPFLVPTVQTVGYRIPPLRGFNKAIFHTSLARSGII